MRNSTVLGTDRLFTQFICYLKRNDYIYLHEGCIDLVEDNAFIVKQDKFPRYA